MAGQSIKEALKGAGEIFIFLPKAIDRFSGAKHDAMKSFVIPAIFYPFILLGFVIRNSIGDWPSLVTHAIVSWSGLFIFFGVIWLAVKDSERRDRFWLFVNAFNWRTVISMVLFAIGVYGYNVVGGAFEQYWIFYLFVNMLYVGFVVTHALRLPWALGAFAATVNLFISDIGFRLIMAAHERVFEPMLLVNPPAIG